MHRLIYIPTRIWSTPVGLNNLINNNRLKFDLFIIFKFDFAQSFIKKLNFFSFKIFQTRNLMHPAAMRNFTLSVSYMSGSCITCHKVKGLGWIRHRTVYLRWQDKSLNWNEMEIHCNLIVFWIPTVAILLSFLKGWWVHVGLFCCWKSFPSIKSSVLRRKTRTLQATPKFEGVLIFLSSFIDTGTQYTTFPFAVSWKQIHSLCPLIGCWISRLQISYCVWASISSNEDYTRYSNVLTSNNIHVHLRRREKKWFKD